MHLFLTGSPRVGKSTIIDHAINQSQLIIGGFCTKGEAVPKGMPSYIYLYPCNSIGMQGSVRVGYRTGEGRLYEAYTEAFDTVGVAALTKLQSVELIIMDELGFMENQAYRFQEKVMHLLEQNVPILGVIKQADTPFLNRVRDHKNVVIWEVKESNRSEIEEKVIKWLDWKKTNKFI